MLLIPLPGSFVQPILTEYDLGTVCIVYCIAAFYQLTCIMVYIYICSYSQIMAKAGISQSNPLAALGNILRKGPGRGSGRESKMEHPVVKQRSFKGSKESLKDGAKNSPEFSRRISEPKSPKMFRFGIRRSSSRRKADVEETASDTASVSSLNFLSVKEEPMQSEPSTLSISQVAVGNGECTELSTVEKSLLSEPPLDSSKSANRSSLYFKAADVEPLPGLFDSGELDALLQKSSKEPSPEQPEPTKSDKMTLDSEKSVQRTEKEEEVQEQPTGGSSLLRNPLRSSFRMYEKQYKAETIERGRRHKEKSPLSTNQISTDTTPAEKPSIFDDDLLDSTSGDIAQSSTVRDNQRSTSTPKVKSKQEGMSLFINDDGGILMDASPVATDLEKDVTDKEPLNTKEKEESNCEKTRRKLLDDELFHSDFQSKSQYRTQKASTSNQSWDVYAKAQKSPENTSNDTRANKKEPKGVDALREVSDPKQEPEVEIPKITLEAESKDKNMISVSAKIKEEDEQTNSMFNEDVPVNAEITNKPQKKELEGKSLSESDAPEVIEKTELEKESQEREANKETTKKVKEPSEQEGWVVVDSTGTNLEEIDSREITSTDLEEIDSREITSEDFESQSKESVVQQKKAQEEEDKFERTIAVLEDKTVTKTESVVVPKSEEKQSRLKQKAGAKEEQKGSKYNKSHDTRSKIEAGKVGSAKSRFELDVSNLSPRTRRARAATDSARQSFDRKPRSPASDADKGSPSWMTELQKRKDIKKDGGKVRNTTVKAPSTHDSKEETPAWKKRIMERKELRKDKVKDAEATVKDSSSTQKNEEEMPAWKMRVMERKRKAAESGTKTGGTSAARLSRHSDATTTGRGSPRSGRSPKIECKSPLSATSKGRHDILLESQQNSEVKSKEQYSKDKSEEKYSEIKLEENVEKSEPTTDKGKVDETDSPQSGEKEKGSKGNISSRKPGISVDTRHSTPSVDKPPITSPKPKINIVSKKVLKESTSSESKEDTKEQTFSIDVKASKSSTLSKSCVSEKESEVELVEKSLSGEMGEKVDKQKASSPTAAEENTETKVLKSPKGQKDDDDDVFSSSSEKSKDRKDVYSPSPQLPASMVKSALDEKSRSRSGSQQSNVCSDQEVRPYRSRSTSHSPSPIPSSYSTSPLKLSADTDVPEWKKQVLERKKMGVTSVKPDKTTSKKVEPEIPAWKKELMSKRKNSEEVSSCMYVYIVCTEGRQ